MFKELYQYLVLNNYLSLTGIGTFHIERMPAQMDFPNKAINAPTYSVIFSQSTGNNNRNLYQWLAGVFNVSEREAVVRLNDFLFQLKKQILDGEVIDWSGVGQLRKDLSGSIRLVPAALEFDFNKMVPAEKVIRENAPHRVRVGEEEKTSVEMTEILALPETRKTNWWAIPLAVGIITIIFIGWYLSQHGVDPVSISNKQRITLKDSVTTHREISNP